MIVTVTLNAAVDRTLTVPNVQLGHRHRASASFTSAGGKGINVERALKRSIDGCLPYVWGIWGSVLVAAALGVLKPFAEL